MDLDQDSKAVGPLTITRNGRRYFSAAHKRLVVERCLAPGASVAAVAIQHGFNANLERSWGGCSSRVAFDIRHPGAHSIYKSVQRAL